MTLLTNGCSLLVVGFDHPSCAFCAAADRNSQCTELRAGSTCMCWLAWLSVAQAGNRSLHQGLASCEADIEFTHHVWSGYGARTMIMVAGNSRAEGVTLSQGQR